MRNLRPSDLAREHGLSAQAIRNYERDGCLPAADRSDTGYRRYTEVHAAALRAFLALVPAHGHATASRIMNAVNDNDLETALDLIDRGHTQLLRDRETLAGVRRAVDHLTTEPATPQPPTAPYTIGELAHRLNLTTATLRSWEDAAILAPIRDPATGYRVYRADDIRDAELTHLLRRGGYPLERIAAVLDQIRKAGGTAALAATFADWQQRLTARGVAMLNAAALLGRYLSVRSSSTGETGAIRTGREAVASDQVLAQ
ncbi:MerR family transcriptional regulator [Nocardia panacis]|uniref:MerR family transcriptional regulator n=1 Tax=Nocardia panacis TaxID=2340916 RepID=A0A3A4KQP5_9NOCA|nr:MerR family transcriptional regulator [Nocardia panacis]RJO78351.1 MerR family transcriptional regulator [Nocardia panacis]